MRVSTGEGTCYFGEFFFFCPTHHEQMHTSPPKTLPLVSCFFFTFLRTGTALLTDNGSSTSCSRDKKNKP